MLFLISRKVMAHCNWNGCAVCLEITSLSLILFFNPYVIWKKPIAPEYPGFLMEGQNPLQYLLGGHQEHLQGTFADNPLGFPCLVSLNEYREQTLAKEIPDGFPAP